MTQTSRLIVCTKCGAVNRTPSSRKLPEGTCGKCADRLGHPSPVDISDHVFAKLQARDQGPYVLDVWAPWCGPCKMMAPAYKASCAKFKGNIRFLKLNSEQFPNAASGLNFRGIPALFFFDEGKLISQRAGALPENAITDWIKTDSKR